MKRALSLVVVTSVCLAGAAAAEPGASERADRRPLRAWNDLALDAVRVARAADGDAARAYAMVNVAIYDAVNGLVSRGPFGRQSALVPPAGAPWFGDLEAAACAAAHAVLVGLFPDQSARFDEEHAADRRRLAHRPGVRAGLAWGEVVGGKVLAARAEDGARPVETVPPGSGPGVFRAAWPNAQFRNLAPFAIADAAPYVSPPPPALDSVAYAAAFAEIAILGNAAIPEPSALASYQFWALAAGTVQPPGEWLKIALEVAEAERLGFYEEARLLALVSMALSDIVAPTYMSKLIYAHWRPATAIIEGDGDGNPHTTGNPTWAPRGGSIGGNPEYTSGHSAFSAAAATVLAGFFCRDDIRFTHLNDGAPDGQPRTYPSFSAAAAEAGRSRIEGGVHFELSNQAGLAAGRGVGAEVLSRALLRKHGPKHFGVCPI